METPTPALDPQAEASAALTAALQNTKEGKQLIDIGWTPTCKLRPMRQSSRDGVPAEFVQPVVLTINRRSILISTLVETGITSVSPIIRARELLVPMLTLATGAVAISETLDA